MSIRELKLLHCNNPGAAECPRFRQAADSAFALFAPHPPPPTLGREASRTCEVTDRDRENSVRCAADGPSRGSVTTGPVVSEKDFALSVATSRHSTPAPKPTPGRVQGLGEANNMTIAQAALRKARHHLNALARPTRWRTGALTTRTHRGFRPERNVRLMLHPLQIGTRTPNYRVVRAAAAEGRSRKDAGFRR